MVFFHKLGIIFLLFRHQIQHYTGQLAKDTNKTLKDLANLTLPISEQVYLS